MSEPDWKTEAQRTAEAFAATDFNGHPVAPEAVRGAVSRYLLGQFMPHIEAAYQRGHEAGSSKAGYRLVQENERLRHELALAHQTNQRKGVCPTCLSAIGASESTASADEPPEGSAP